MPLTAGTRLGPHEIVAAIGAGGMGFLIPHPPSSNEAGLTMPVAVVENWAAGLEK